MNFRYLLLALLLSALLLVPSRAFCQRQQTIFSIRNFGATGDGKTLDTKAINDAIDAASKAGGGTVLLPAGTYLSFSIHLASHISLYLDQGCTLVAADSSSGGYEGYDAAEPNEWGDKYQYQDFGHSHWHNSLIWGENLVDISILGPGTIYGKGLSRGLGRLKPGMGNKAIALKLCRNVIMRDFTVTYGGHFGILATGIDNLTIDNLKMDTNRDGMDIDCCRNVRVSNCTVNSPFDDGICLKSSFALGYARATENVTITNCEVSGFDRGTLIDGTYQRKEWNLVPDHEGPTGRIKFGTESNGGYKNITITNCVFNYCRGLALEAVDGAIIEDVTISNIVMKDVTNSPIFLRIGARMRGPEGTPIGKLRRVLISDIMVYNADSHFASIISGLPANDIEDVTLKNIRLYYRQMDSAQSAIQQTVPEHEKTYPEPAKMGVMPCYGFFIRHARNIELNGVSTYYLGKETRPPFVLDDVKQGSFYKVDAQKVNGKAVIEMSGVSDISIESCAGVKDRKIGMAKKGVVQ